MPLNALHQKVVLFLTFVIAIPLSASVPNVSAAAPDRANGYSSGTKANNKDQNEGISSRQGYMGAEWGSNMFDPMLGMGGMGMLGGGFGPLGMGMLGGLGGMGLMSSYSMIYPGMMGMGMMGYPGLMGMGMMNPMMGLYGMGMYPGMGMFPGILGGGFYGGNQGWE